MAYLLQEWNVWEIQIMVLFSFMLQLFLLPIGSLRQSNTNGLLKVLTWLAYVGADLVAVYALGLFSQYEDKLGKQSSADTLPFIWVPFLLVHLGGQDSITAFSIEDNNLWLRHVLNLVMQGAIALYVFWKSLHRISYSILMPAFFIFVAGIIKYGERAWALKSASRDGLVNSIKLKLPEKKSDGSNIYPSQASYAHQTVLRARGLFVGRTVHQLGSGIGVIFRKDFQRYGQGEETIKIIRMELGMLSDLLYTKASVLQRWIGVIFRFASQILTVVAFALFLKSEKHAHGWGNVAISYILFIGAIFTEACSVCVAIASPWTEAHLHGGHSLHWIWLCNRARSLLNAVRCNKRHRSTFSMGQFNFMDSCITREHSNLGISKVISAIGLGKQWRNLWYVQHIDASNKGIIWPVLDLVGRLPNARTVLQHLNMDKLKYTLRLPFEHALYRLHVYTDLHISKHYSVYPPAPNVRRLKEECENLSNYMMYLMVVYPTMLPVSTAAEDLEPALLRWVRDVQVWEWDSNKLTVLQQYVNRELFNQREQNSGTPFEPAQGEPCHLEESLGEIKEVWLRLLVYVAGKCRGELHARQLGNGGELITFVWLLLVHHGLGDVATELKLLTSDDPPDAPAEVPPSLISVHNCSWRLRRQGPRYAFDFRQPSPQAGREALTEAGQDEAAASTETAGQDEAAASTEAGQDEAAASGEKGIIEVEEQMVHSTQGRVRGSELCHPLG